MNAFGVEIVYAFDPLVELSGATGILALSAELAGRLIAEHRAESVRLHACEPLRYVAGSRANEAARLALRAMRGDKAAGAARSRRVAKLEG